MGRTILWSTVSLDGFFEGPEREIDWHMVDGELHRHFNAELAAMGGFLDGRVTWELMAAYWPTADQDPGNAGPVAEFARSWREMPKWVFSRTLVQAGWNTRIMRDVVPAEIRELQRGTRGDLVVGGAELAAEFMRQGLIDEYRLYVQPVILGRGIETRTFASGVVLLRYAQTRG